MAEMTAQYLSQTDAPDRFDSNYNSNYGSNASFCLPIRSGYGQVAENEFSPSPSSSVLSTEDTSIDIEDCLEDCECKQAERAEKLRAKAVLDARRATRTVDIDVVLRYARLGLCPLPPGTTEESLRDLFRRDQRDKKPLDRYAKLEAKAIDMLDFIEEEFNIDIEGLNSMIAYIRAIIDQPWTRLTVYTDYVGVDAEDTSIFSSRSFLRPTIVERLTEICRCYCVEAMRGTLEGYELDVKHVDQYWEGLACEIATKGAAAEELDANEIEIREWELDGVVNMLDVGGVGTCDVEQDSGPDGGDQAEDDDDMNWD